MMAPSALVNGIGGLFNSEKFADLIVRCSDRSWFAHKNVLCTQSEFFEAASEGNTKEGNKVIIDLDEDEPQIVEAVLRYLYTGTYSDLPQGRDSITAAQINVRVFALAEKYCIESLLTIALEKFKAAAQRSWGTDGFAEAVYEAYTITNDDKNLLRDSIVDAVLVNFEELFTPGNVFLRFKQALVALPGFGAEVSQVLAEEFIKECNMGNYRCPNQQCTTIFRSGVKLREKADWCCPGCNHTCSRTFSKWQNYRKPVTIVEGYKVEDIRERTRKDEERDLE